MVDFIKLLLSSTLTPEDGRYWKRLTIHCIAPDSVSLSSVASQLFSLIVTFVIYLHVCYLPAHHILIDLIFSLFSPFFLSFGAATLCEFWPPQ